MVYPPNSRTPRHALDFPLWVTTGLRTFIQPLVMLVIVWLLIIFPQANNSEAIEEHGNSNEEEELEKKYKNAVVYLSTEAIDDMNKSTPFTGSGFIISKNGYIITANHVIPLVCGKGKNTKQTLPCYKKIGRTKVRIGSIKAKDYLEATVLSGYQDPTIDLALLKIVHPPSDMSTVDIGDPNLVLKYKDLYLAGFPSPEDFFITKGKLQSLTSQQHGRSNRWVAKLDAIWGDSGGPVFFNREVVAVAQSGMLGTEKNKYLAPIILADKYLQKAGVWPRWKGMETVIKKLASRYKAVTAALKTTKDTQISRAREEELFEIRERQNNQKDSVREYRYRLFEVGSALEEMRVHFEEQGKAQDFSKALDALNRGDAEPTTQLLKDVSITDGSNAGEANYQLGSIAEINIDYESALSWYRLALSKPNPKAIYFDAAADMAHKLGDHESALQWAKESVRLRERDVGKDEPGLAIALCRLGGFVVEYDPDMTIQNCEKALTVLALYTGQELEIAEVHDNLGAAYEFSANYSRAEEEYLKALDISERIGAVTQGVRAQKIFANINNNLAGLYRSMGRYRDSLPLTEKAVLVNERIFGKNHPRLGIDMAGLAILKRDLGDYAESEKLFQQARLLLTSAIGRNNRHVGAILYHMAPLALIQKNDDEALKLAKEALGVFKKLFGNEQSIYEMRTRMIMAEIKSIQGQQKEAQRDLDHAEMINQSKHYGHAAALRILLLRAAILIRQSEFQDANTLIKKYQEFSTGVKYSNNPLLGELSLIMGRVYSGTGQLKAAETELEKAQQLFSISLGPQHPKRAAALRELAQVQSNLGKLNISAGTDALSSKIFSAHPGVRVITAIDL